MGIFSKIKPLFKAQVPNLDNYIGAWVKLPEGPTVRIEKIVGSIPFPKFYEINEKHHIGMLRFHAQMEGAKDITEEQFRQFEEMEIGAKKDNEDELMKNRKKMPGMLQ